MFMLEHGRGKLLPLTVLVSYLSGLVEAHSVVQSQTLRQRHLAASLQTSDLEKGGHWQKLQSNHKTSGLKPPQTVPDSSAEVISSRRKHGTVKCLYILTGFTIMASE